MSDKIPETREAVTDAFDQVDMLIEVQNDLTSESIAKAIIIEIATLFEIDDRREIIGAICNKAREIEAGE